MTGTGAEWTAPGRVGAAAVSLGGSGQLETGSPVLDTVHPAGFTVAAWVRLTDLTANHTAVSQDGANTSAFRLGYRTDLDLNADGTADQAWCFSVAGSDTVDTAWANACTTDYVVNGDWVHLVGIVDRPTGVIKLYVNGTSEMGGAYAQEAAPAGWAATGKLAVGRSVAGVAVAEPWVGDVDEVYGEQDVWADQEIFDRSNP